MEVNEWVNDGEYLSLPLESGYAKIRRCMVVNPDVRLQTIKQQLQTLYPDAGSYNERIALHCGKPPTMPISLQGHSRQCPACSAILYHTDMFNLPWLKICPIHRLELSGTCPECLGKWPDTIDLEQRKCSTCGIPSLEELSARKRDATPVNSRFESLVALWKLIAEDIANHSKKSHFNSSPTRPAINHVDLTSLSYPYNKWNDDESLDGLMNALSIDREMPYRKLIEDGLERSQIFSGDRYSTTESCVRYQALRKLAGALSTPPSARLEITYFSQLLMDDFMNGPPPCPSCLLVNLWWFLNASQQLPRRLWEKISNYSLGRAVGYRSILSPDNALASVDYDFRSKIGGAAFNAWFQARLLEFCFLELGYLVAHLCECHRTGVPLPFESPEQIIKSEVTYSIESNEYGENLFLYSECAETFMAPGLGALGDKQCIAFHEYVHDRCPAQPIGKSVCSLASFDLHKFSKIDNDMIDFLRIEQAR
jgi:hypothetical protein